MVACVNPCLFRAMRKSTARCAFVRLEVCAVVCMCVVCACHLPYVRVASAVDRSTPGDSSFMSPVIFVTVLTTLETTIEILTSSLVPRVYSLERE